VEARRQTELLLARLDAPLARAVPGRVVAVLERIDTTAARALLKTVSAADSPTGREAAAALRRLGARATPESP
jgi:hypothetical protein